ncbi:electron transfer complex ferredoxin TmcB [Pseudodesulfovibrio piezophilus]|uniref:Tmc complex, sububit B 4Fe-4S domain protein n=1 Tax=Pseudodesulfovibrio piezophilus (strain DSM 21447 / JCM 15486 / C1TLV30) TaxID=1322246 RepID=M1WV58_PSEP2|nr:(Fe-S)-binding protein [Pseudodesulfovibrio piezophilus]CCH48183.1 Tmc complex, sububit B 4Fe-4S domain protein [Pseudodesulfovibrio piezophilus C1TLV30]
MSHIADRIIADPGLESGVAKLTSERIEEVVNRVLKGETGAKLKAYQETCMRCGLCSQACHYYMSHDNDPSYSPVSKATDTVYKLMEKKGKVYPYEIYQMAQIAYTECNLCKRCAHYCPIGIDTGYIMSTMRRICYLLDVVPQYISDTAHSHASTMNQMWVKDDEWIDSLQWQEDEARDEFPDLRIPLDKEGADVYYSVIAPEPKFRTQLIYQAAAIMHQAGVDYTMTSGPGWDNSDMCMFVGDFENMGRLKRSHYESAQKLRVKRIVMGECGHAFRSVYDMGNRWLGYRESPVPVIHAVEFYWELLTQGKIKLTGKFDKPVTIQDPCNIIRGRGLMDKLRDVTHMLCDNVIEMSPNREHNYCCCAGGGVINCGPPFKGVRMQGNRVKAEQLAATGVEHIVVPCHNCHGGLEDIIGHYDLGMHAKFLGDIIYELMEKPEGM